jgi:hypothetical protein
MSNPQIMIGDSFKDHTAFPIAAFVQPLPSKRAILPSPMHAIILPSIPVNPLDAFCARIWVVSSSFGCHRQVGPNTATTADKT